MIADKMVTPNLRNTAYISPVVRDHLPGITLSSLFWNYSLRIRFVTLSKYRKGFILAKLLPSKNGRLKAFRTKKLKLITISFLSFRVNMSAVCFHP